MLFSSNSYIQFQKRENYFQSKYHNTRHKSHVRYAGKISLFFQFPQFHVETRKFPKLQSFPFIFFCPDVNRKQSQIVLNWAIIYLNKTAEKSSLHIGIFQHSAQFPTFIFISSTVAQFHNESTNNKIQIEHITENVCEGRFSSHFQAHHS